MKPAFPPKDPLEIVRLAFNFAQILEAGETVTAAEWLVEVQATGADASAALLSGAVEVASPRVSQVVKAGVDGVTYFHRSAVTTSEGRVLVLGAIQVVVKGAVL